MSALETVLGTILTHLPDALDAQAAFLDTLVSALCLELVRVQDRIAASAPVGRLPDDALVQIFSYATRATTSSPYAATSPVAAAIAGTCRRWRTLALAHPALWTRVDLRHPSAPHALKYSRRLGLYVRLDAPLWQDRDAALAPALAPHVSRLRQCWIQTAATHIEAFLHAISGPTQLERLVITGRYTDEYPVTLPAALLGRLRHLSLTHAHIAPVPTPTNLLTLSLKPPPGAPPISLSTLTSLLRASPNLTELSLAGGAVPVYKPGEPQPPPDARADLARLKTLRIAGVNPVQAAWVLFHLSYPASTTLHLDLETSRPLRTAANDKPRPPGELESYLAVLTMFRTAPITPLDSISLQPAMTFPTDPVTEKLSAQYSTAEAKLSLLAGSRSGELLKRLVVDGMAGVTRLVLEGVEVALDSGMRGQGLESVRTLEIRACSLPWPHRGQTGAGFTSVSVPQTPVVPTPTQTSPTSVNKPNFTSTPSNTTNANAATTVQVNSTNPNANIVINGTIDTNLATPKVASPPNPNATSLSPAHNTGGLRTPYVPSFPIWTPHSAASALMTPFIPRTPLPTAFTVAGMSLATPRPNMPALDAPGAPMMNGFVSMGIGLSNVPGVTVNGVSGTEATDKVTSPVTSESTTAVPADPEPAANGGEGGSGSVHSASADTTLASAGTDSGSSSDGENELEDEEGEEDTDSNGADGGSTLYDLSDTETDIQGRPRRRPGTPGPRLSSLAESTMGTVGGSTGGSGVNSPQVETPDARVTPLPNPFVQNLRTASMSNLRAAAGTGSSGFGVRSQSTSNLNASGPPPPKRSSTTPYGFASYATGPGPTGFGTRPIATHKHSLPASVPHTPLHLFDSPRPSRELAQPSDDTDIRLLSALSYHLSSLEEVRIVRSTIRGSALVKFIQARNNADSDSDSDDGVQVGIGSPVLTLELVECPYVTAEHVRVLRESVDDVRWRP